MHSANRRRTRSWGFGLEQINGGKVHPTVDKVSKQSNASVPPSLKTSEARSLLKTVEKSQNDANGNGHLHGGEVIDNGIRISNGVSGEEGYRSTPQTGKKRSHDKSSGSNSRLVSGLPCNVKSETHQSRMSAMSSKRLRGGGERNELVSSRKRARKSKEAAVSSSADVISTPVDRPKKRKKNMKKGKVREDDEYTRMKRKLRYILKRINYEQSLIDAYSSEGWKGSSLEKLRPEKELERATKEILQCKVKIRDLFQQLDTLCAEGSLPQSLFDSDGEISSEDIFCAKCGSKDLLVDNDIIFCDRGFHQYCVEPPFLKEDIPPGDESWLCPGCDCKDDCLDLLNDSLGTKLSVNDSWEKVFPEAAAAIAGGDSNLNCDLPSDDSDDEDYDPDGLNDDDGGNDETDNQDGSSDESDFTSASDEMIGGSFKAKEIMGLPSDDSEDDDYDPDAPTLDEDKLQGSSNSDCTSESENLETSFKGDESNQLDEVVPHGRPGRKKSQLPDVSISEADAGGDQGLAEVPRRRNVERLDYKKLYEEEYENVPSSSSDDEDWDKTAGKEDYESADEMVATVPMKQSSKAEVKKKPKQKSKRENNNETLKATVETTGENGCSGEKNSSSANKQVELRTQRLFKSFQENHYPDNTTKESLAKELHMTIKQVNDWFMNRRFSTSKTMVSKGDVEKLRTGKQGKEKTSVAGSSKGTKETESDVGGGQGLAEVPRRRNVERLDYKKLYDEEYENVPSSSSDDEDWDKSAGKEDYESADERDTLPLKQSSKAEEKTKPIQQQSKRRNKKVTLKATQETPGPNGCSGEKSISSACKQSDLKTQISFKSFQKNRYPDKTTKESLAKELKMTVKQVNDWFRNKRFWTSKTMDSKGDVEKLTTVKQGKEKTSVAGSNKRTKETESVAERKSRASKSTNTGSRKKRRR